jgi:hypothetical protein
MNYAYVSFQWRPVLEAETPNFNVCFFREKECFEKKLIKTKETAISAVS